VTVQFFPKKVDDLFSRRYVRLSLHWMFKRQNSVVKI